MMTLDRAADILRKAKFGATKPQDKKALPKYMETWTEEKINAYYDKQKDFVAALDIAISALNSLQHFKKASYELVDIFDKLGEEDNKKE